LLHVRRIRTWFKTHADLRFWLIFGLLNALLFLPEVLANQEPSSFWSTLAGTWRAPDQMVSLLAVWRPTPDLARLHLEWLLLVALLTAVRPLRRPLSVFLLCAFYLFALIYAVYEAVMRSLYLMEPVFYSQYRMLTEGLAFVLDSMTLPVRYWLLAICGGGLLLAALYGAINALISQDIAGRISRFSQVLLSLLVLFGLGQAVRYQYHLARPEVVVSSLFYKIQTNVQESRRIYEIVRAFDDSYVRRAYDYRGQSLVTKPNVYLLFVESYGSVPLQTAGLPAAIYRADR
jgi:hypothetical protein